MSSKPKEVVAEVPMIVVDPSTKKRYTKGKFLGKGGFAKCYELIDMETKEIFAGKIVAKTSLTKEHQKEKMKQEIEIHRGLKHKNVVGFHSYFEDSNFVYIILEFCRKRSLMEMHKRRKFLTERETRYFLYQIASGCKYLHAKRIIHRDLKLGNLFLSEDLVIKLGDFGLATQLDYDGERKRTLCGTPNYIAPEVLGKKGHSYEVDAWSLGCIIFTLLVGRPPFETSCLQDTYKKIRKNEYQVPPRVPPLAKNLIQKLLHAEPSHRPSMDQVLSDPFLTTGSSIPGRLPNSCLTTAPRADETLMAPPSSRKPLGELNKGDNANFLTCESKPSSDKAAQPGDEPSDLNLVELQSLLGSVVSSRPSDKAVIREDDALDPASAPIFWITKWVDYSDKYGLGYQLSDNSCGVVFNDSTRIIELCDGRNIHYVERDGTEHYHTSDNYPSSLNKKVTLLNYFKNYMKDHLLRTGGEIAPREGDEFSRLPYLKTWFRTRTAIVLQLANGTIQINFFQDHTKIIVCPLMGVVTYISESKDFNTYNLKRIEKYGCSQDLFSRLRYAKTMVDRLIVAKPNRGRAKEN